MNSKDTRSEAEIYRQERKERIKKDAAKTKKGTGKAGKIISRIIAVVLCVAIAFGGVWFLASFFGWGEKLTTVATVQVGDESVKISQAKFNFYYMAAYNSAVNTSYQYSQYGYNFGYDYTQSPTAQKTTDADGNEITYAEKFKNDAIASIEETLYYAGKAKAEGLELTDHELGEIEETMDSLRSQAKQYNCSLSAFIIQQYGKGLNAKLFEDYLTEQMMAHRYQEYLEETYADSYTDAEIQAKYDEDPNAYNNIDVRVYGFAIGEQTDEDGNTVTPEYTDEQQKERALEMQGKITDEASFKSLILEYCTAEEREDFAEDDASLAKGMAYSSIKSNMGEEEADWAFSADRSAGDTTIWETDSYIYVVYLVKPVYKTEQNYVSVRHLLVKFPDEESAEPVVTEPVTNEDGEEVEVEVTVPVTHLDDGIAYEGKKHDKDATETLYKETPATNEDAKKIAESYLEKYNAGDKTEEAFAKLADLYSDDTSSTSAGNGEGGLIENMKPGQYVAEFENWAFDPARKPGDVEIVETEFGYHLMYFVSAEDEPIWKTDIRNDLASAKVTEELEAQEEDYTGTLTANDKAMTKAYDKCVDFVSGKTYA